MRDPSSTLERNGSRTPLVHARTHAYPDPKSHRNPKPNARQAGKNDIHALSRHELLEVIVRLAVWKFKNTGMRDVSDMVKKLLEECFAPQCAPGQPCHGAAYDTNEFRRERLYCEEVDIVLRKHQKVS